VVWGGPKSLLDSALGTHKNWNISGKKTFAKERKVHFEINELIYIFTAKVSRSTRLYSGTGLPDGIFSKQESDLGKFWRVLQWKTLAFYMSICSILWLFGICFPRFGMLNQEKSGNPALERKMLVFYMSIWSILWLVGIFSPLLYCTKNNLATLLYVGRTEAV
jgi:hypothetical protein